MGLALHVILRLDQEDCILGRGLTAPYLEEYSTVPLVLSYARRTRSLCP
jgi:hypothetical protein